MDLKLRDYQQDAIDLAIADLVKYKKVVMELATGAGKSVINAKLVDMLLDNINQNEKIICIQPSKELVEQNRDSFIKFFKKEVSTYCASAGLKQLSRQVIFCSPLSIKSCAEKLRGLIKYVIIDECHLTTPTIQKFVNSVDTENDIKIIGLTATPFKLGKGFIYRFDQAGTNLVDCNFSRKPTYDKLSCSIKAEYLVESGYLTKPIIKNVATGYHDDNNNLTVRGEDFTDESIADFVSDDSETDSIICEILAKTKDSMGVMIFAANINHAEYIHKSISDSVLVTSNTKKADRIRIINDFKSKKIKYLVNVSVLTTGFDAPHVDAIAILRPTMSNGLYQQIIGRGLRLHDDKKHVDIFDYAENIERLNLEDGLLNPKIKKLVDSKYINLICPTCELLEVGLGKQKVQVKLPAYANLIHDHNGYSSQIKDFIHNTVRCKNKIMSKRCNYTFQVKRESAGEKKEIEFSKTSKKTNENYIELENFAVKRTKKGIKLLFNDRKYKFIINKKTGYSELCSYRSAFGHLKSVDDIINDFIYKNFPTKKPTKIKVNKDSEVIGFI